MSLGLQFDDASAAVASAVAQFCRDAGADAAARAEAAAPSRELWLGLAELGVLGLAAPGGDGGPVELVAAFEALGEVGFPGPLVAAVFGAQVLPSAERTAVVRGRALVSLGTPPLLPWAPVADLFIELDGDGAWLAEPRGSVEPVATLGGEIWGRVEGLERGAALDGVARGRAVADLARAAWLVGGARRLLEVAAEHAKTRVQFGRAIGEFQAVAHPLADCWTGLAAAEALERSAAHALARGDADAVTAVAAARLSAVRAGLAAVSACHQVLGALGITVEGPLFHVSRRVRQLASSPPDEVAARAALLADLGLGSRS